MQVEVGSSVARGVDAGRVGYSLKQWLSVSVGVLVSLVAMSYVAWKIDWRGVGGLWERLAWPTVVGMIAVYMSSYLVRGWRWQLMLAPIQAVSWRRTTSVVVIGYMANNLLPFRMGEVVRGLVLSRLERVNPIMAISSIGVERVLDALTLIGCLAISSAYLPSRSELAWGSGATGWLLLVFGSVVGGVLFARMAPRAFRRMAEGSVGFLPLGLRGKILTLVDRVLDSIQFIGWNRSFLMVLVLSWMTWAIEGMVFWIGLRSMGLESSFAFAMFCLAVVNLTILIPSAPGYVGVFQLGALFAFSTQGWEADDAVAYAILIHLCQFLPVTLGGLVLLNTMGLSLRTLTQTSPSRTSELH